MALATPTRPDIDIPDPFDDADALEELEDEIATLAAHIHAATERLLALIAAFDRRKGWELGGHRSCAHWLHARTGIDLGAAREKVRTARALEALPLTSEAMGRGELSFSQVRALTRVATPECEAELLGVAQSSNTAQLERFVRAWRQVSGGEEAELERRRHASRELAVFPDEAGMYVVKGRVTPEVGAILMRAVEAAGDALYRGEARYETTAKQRRADALGLLAERALATGFGGEGGGERRGERGARPIPVSGSRAERYQVVVHVDADRLRSEGHDRDDDQEKDAGAAEHAADGSDRSDERSHLDDGTRVSAETSRRLACDASVVEVTRDEDGSVLNVGRRTRTISSALRRALDIRDQGCRFPGCGLRFTEAHHVKHWADGGETSLCNTLLLCRFHHRKLHEEGWRVDFDVGTNAGGHDATPVFSDPRGQMWVGARPRPRPLPDHPAAALIAENRARGIDPDGWSLAPRRHAITPRDRRTSPALDPGIPWAVEVRALEALDEAHYP